jgi:hypothetical protein
LVFFSTAWTSVMALPRLDALGITRLEKRIAFSIVILLIPVKY